MRSTGASFVDLANETDRAGLLICPVRTPLPADLLGVRLAEHQQQVSDAERTTAQVEAKAVAKKAISLVVWIVIVSTVVPLVIMIGVGVVMAIVGHEVAHQLPHVQPPPHGSHGH